MLVLKELIYFISALFLLEILMCLLMIGGDVMNELHKRLFGVDVIAMIRRYCRNKSAENVKDNAEKHCKNVQMTRKGE